MIKLLLFDLDGTLIDSAPDLIYVANTLLAENGHDPLPDEVIIAAIGFGLQKLVYDLLPEAQTSPELLRKLGKRYVQLYEQNLLVRTRIYPGVDEFLAGCDVKIAMITNKLESLAKKIVADTSLARYHWLTVIGGNTYAKQKPDPLPLIEALRLAGVDHSEAVMIGDGRPDLIAARLAGIHSVALSGGYTQLSLLQAEHPTRIIASFAELTKALAEISALGPREVR